MKTRTHWDPRHPRNRMHKEGQQAKEYARKLSNAELDKLLTDNVEEPLLTEVLKYPRHKKIQFVKYCAMRSFAEAAEAKAENPVLEEAKVPPNG